MTRTIAEEKQLFDTLVDHVLQLGGRFAKNAITLHEFEDGTSRGIVAVEDIAAGTVLAEIPQRHVLCKENVLRVEALREVFARHEEMEEMDVLALFLMWVTHEDNIDLVDPCMRSHIRLMPEVDKGLSALHQHMFWTEKELMMIQGTDAVHTADQLKQQVRGDFGKLLADVMMEFPELFPLDSTRFTYKTYKWALALIWSRAMDFLCPTSSAMQQRSKSNTKFQRRLRAIVPLCDMFNTDFQGEVSHYYNADNDTICLRATRDFRAGEQVFINYSPVPHARMVQLYGFVVHPAPAFNSIQLWTVMDPSHAPFRQISDKMKKHFNGAVDPQTAPFILTEREPLPDILIQALNIQRGFDPFEKKSNLTVLKELEAALLQRRKSYISGTLQEEEERLRSAEGERERIAIVIRIGEKKIIDRALQKIGLIVRLKYSEKAVAEVEAEDLIPSTSETAKLDELD